MTNKEKIMSDDEGALQIAIYCKDNNVIIHFGKKVAWLGMGKKEVENLIEVLQKNLLNIK